MKVIFIAAGFLLIGFSQLLTSNKTQAETKTNNHSPILELPDGTDYREPRFTDEHQFV
jgi:hypothetical protein